MTDGEKGRDLGHMPPPRQPHKAKSGGWKKPFAILFGIVGVVASTATVVGLVQGWFSSEPTADELAQESVEKLSQLEKKLTAEGEDKHLVNQVSRRVTELGDQYKRLRGKMKDIRRLDKSLSARADKKKILTPDQKKLDEASRRKETEELLVLVQATERMAQAFVASVKGDETLEQVQSEGSQTARTKARALKQSTEVESTFLPELKKVLQKYND